MWNIKNIKKYQNKDCGLISGSFVESHAFYDILSDNIVLKCLNHTWKSSKSSPFMLCTVVDFYIISILCIYLWNLFVIM